MEELEQKLGFRVGDRGVELLSFKHNEDGSLKETTVRAVQPVMNLGQMWRMWNVIKDITNPKPEQRVEGWEERARGYKAQVDAMHNQLARAFADVEFWKNKSFEEHEWGEQLKKQIAENMQPTAMLASEAKDSFGTPKEVE
jgi:hypothetical protein